MKIARRMAAAFAAALSAAVLLTVGCRRIDNVVYSDFETVPTGGWDPARVIGFMPWPLDSVAPPGARYDLDLCVRFSARSKPSPLRLVVMQDNGETQTSDTITVRLEPPKAGPGGRGAYGVYEVTQPLARAIPLQEGYLVELRSLTAREGTRGLLDVGVLLSETGSGQ